MFMFLCYDNRRFCGTGVVFTVQVVDLNNVVVIVLLLHAENAQYSF